MTSRGDFVRPEPLRLGMGEFSGRSHYRDIALRGRCRRASLHIARARSPAANPYIYISVRPGEVEIIVHIRWILRTGSFEQIYVVE
jgi:hypothetical protein